jgi:endonuclease/exonuclease/phosphatase family metal-dependent hydrolase
MKILLGDFNAKVGREDFLNRQLVMKAYTKLVMVMGVRSINLVTCKNLTVKSMMFQHHHIHKYTWTSPDRKTHNQIDHILLSEGFQVDLMFDHSGQQIVILTSNMVVANLWRN